MTIGTSATALRQNTNCPTGATFAASWMAADIAAMTKSANVASHRAATGLDLGMNRSGGGKGYPALASTPPRHKHSPLAPCAPNAKGGHLGRLARHIAAATALRSRHQRDDSCP